MALSSPETHLSCARVALARSRGRVRSSAVLTLGYMDLRTALTLCSVWVNGMPPKDGGWRAMAVGTESQAMARQACGK